MISILLINDACVRMRKIFLTAAVSVGLVACSSTQRNTSQLPIADLGLVRIDQIDPQELNQVFISALLLNSNLAERSQFATMCYRDLALEQIARTNAKMNPKMILGDVAAMAAARNQEAIRAYPTTRYWTREKIEALTAPIASGRDGLSVFDVFVNLPANKRLKGNGKSRSTGSYGPLVSNSPNNSWAFQNCNINYEVPKLHLNVPVDPKVHQAQIYAVSKENSSLKFTADVDVEFDFVDCKLSGCTPRITRYEVRSFKFGWDLR